MENFEKMKLIFLTDGYKYSHKAMYPAGTTKVVSNWTPRKQSYYHSFDTKTVHFGHVYLKHALEKIVKDFFTATDSERKEAYEIYERLFPNSAIKVSDWESIRELGYLPIKIKALPEGTAVHENTPVLTIENTLPEYFWLTNYFETYLSQTLWLGSTNATYARDLYHMLEKFLDRTSDNPGSIIYQAHDFSARGLASYEASIISGLAHLHYFKGSDTMSAVYYRELLYGDAPRGIVPASEHAVMSAGGSDNELETISRLLDTYPTFILSIVSDTWDYFNTLTEIYPALKDKILARDGKVVVRPDSGNPVDIVCGDLSAPYGTPEHKGTLQLLAETFGYTVNSKGYKVLDPHIGVLYGDGMNFPMIKQILTRMEMMGYSTENIVFGIGSFQYQYSTRDNFSFAMKATFAVIDGVPTQIFKDPKTDSGKTSHKGLTCVYPDLTWRDGFTEDQPEDIREVVLENIGK